MSKKVAILKKDLSLSGGLEKQLLKIYERFLSKGCDVTIVTTSPCFSNDITTCVIPSTARTTSNRLLEFDTQCKKWLSTQSFDVVLGMDRTTCHTHLRAGNGVHAFYLDQRRRYEGFFKSLTFSLNPLHSTTLKLEKQGFESPHVKKIYVNSFMVKQQLRDYYPLASDKIEVIHNGVEWEAMEEDFQSSFPNKNSLCAALGLNPYAHQFLFVGHNYKRKGLDFLLKGLSKIKELSFELSVIGQDKNLRYYHKLAHQMGITDKVKFFGPQSHSRIFYQVADTLVIPSIYDPFANVTIEALAMGTYVISSLSNGGHEVIPSFGGEKIENLLDSDQIAYHLKNSFNHPKTPSSAQKIRSSVQSLGFEKQVDQLINSCLQI